VATLRDVARQAGVDPSTVSRVVNADRRLAIREETRRRILAAVRDLGYRPHAAARGLRQRSTRTIGCLVADASDPATAAAVAGALDAATQAGYGLLLLGGPPGEGRIDGLVRIGGQGEVACPEVTVGAYGRSYFVTTDDEAGARRAVEHLLSRGHRRVGCVVREMGDESAFARFQGYRAALAAAGLRFDFRLVGGDPDRLAAAGATALFAADLQLGAMPVEAVVWGEHVRVPWRRLGEEAVRLLCEVLAGRPPARRGRLVAPLCGPFPGAGIASPPAKLSNIEGSRRAQAASGGSPGSRRAQAAPAATPGRRGAEAPPG
jgi:hypothetical protein